MDLTASLDAPCSADELFVWVDDLARYPSWLTIVPRAVAVAGHDGDAGPAWSVDLRGRLGPFARSKRLRMVRTVHEGPRHARFERREIDGRQHAPWVLDAEVVDRGLDDDGSDGSRLEMRLHYGGSLWLPVVDRILREEIERSRLRLLAIVAA